MSYSGFNHHDKERGYQNVKTAKAFAKFVVKHLQETYPDIKNMNGAIIGLDNSSTFLAAFIKRRLPELNLVSGRKRRGEAPTFLGHVGSPDFIIFADDYHFRGKVTREVIEWLETEYNFEAHECKALHLYYIQAYNSDDMRYYTEDLDLSVQVTTKVMQ